MEPTEKARFDSLCQTHLRALKLRGFSESTIDVYARVVDGRDAVGKTTQELKLTAALAALSPPHFTRNSRPQPIKCRSPSSTG